MKLAYLIGILTSILFAHAYANETTEQKIQELQEQIDLLASAIEDSSSTSNGWWDKTSIGGYGEIVGKFYGNEQKLDQTDAYRGVFYIGYKFTDEWSLNTELEFEHGDEAFLEFGYLDYTPKEPKPTLFIIIPLNRNTIIVVRWLHGNVSMQHE